MMDWEQALKLREQITIAIADGMREGFANMVPMTVTLPDSRESIDFKAGQEAYLEQIDALIEERDALAEKNVALMDTIDRQNARINTYIAQTADLSTELRDLRAAH